MGIGVTAAASAIRCIYRSWGGASLGFTGWSNDVPTSTLSYDVGGGYHLFGFVQTSLATPNNVTLLRDGTTQLATTAGNLANSSDGFSVGSLRGNGVGGYYTDMDVAEILVFYTAISQSTREQAEGYLAHKWGLTANLPAGHPYKTTPP